MRLTWPDWEFPPLVYGLVESVSLLFVELNLEPPRSQRYNNMQPIFQFPNPDSFFETWLCKILDQVELVFLAIRCFLGGSGFPFLIAWSLLVYYLGRRSVQGLSSGQGPRIPSPPV